MSLAAGYGREGPCRRGITLPFWYSKLTSTISPLPTLLIVRIDLHNLHHAKFLVVHHVAVQDKAPGEIPKSRAKGYVSVSGHHHCVVPTRFDQFLAIDCHHFEGIGVNVENMIVIVLIDDGPLLDRA
jgi:hypothetical protein